MAFKCKYIYIYIYKGLILESNDINAFFQKKGQKWVKKGKIFENLSKNVQRFNIF